MELKDIQEFIEKNKDNEEVQDYIGGLTMTSDRVESYLENEKGKKLLQPRLDSYFSKGLETWKENNLETLINEEIKSRFPEKDVKDIELEKVKAELEQIKVDALRKELINKALLAADEKKLPKDLVEYFIGNDEETTIKNLEVLEEIFANHVEVLVQERLKDNSYQPPSDSDKKKTTLKDLEGLNPEQINKMWDKLK